ncbi:MAG: exosortase/archaeosortase family protein [Candidatus Aenigmarchaeota archaeon]|nr:exosortase/archaeosortase family protein [Candidatus Aenigmarchaeota archaeon]
MARIRLNQEQGRLWVVVKFLLRLTALSLPLYIVLWANPSFDFIQYAVRDSVLSLTQAVGIDAEVDGFDLKLGTVDGAVTLNIAADCTGWKSAVAYVALLLAVPGISNRKRLIGLAGIPILYAVNVLRIAFLVWVVNVMGFGYFRIFHEYLWKLGLSLAVLLVWYVWLTKIADRIKPEKFISY